LIAIRGFYKMSTVAKTEVIIVEKVSKFLFKFLKALSDYILC